MRKAFLCETAICIMRRLKDTTMMTFTFHIKTKVLFGKNAVKNHRTELLPYGKKAFIVTGKTSARSSGALNDIEASLQQLHIEYRIYDRVENNPSLETAAEAGSLARDFHADFIIGIGGGSPLDAAKAVAVLAVNSIEPSGLFQNEFTTKPLPVIAVPTTAGTGSEVTQYSILTRNDLQTKQSFGNDETFPAIAFIDPRYTVNLSRDVTIHTAVDAFSHAVEGYLCKRSMPVSDALAVEAIRVFAACLKPLLHFRITEDIREKLLYMSLLGGMVIAHTGTTIVHGLGYSLTFFKNIPHGKANGLLLEEYFNYNYEVAGGKIDAIIGLLGLNSIAEFGEYMRLLLQDRVVLTDEEASLYSSRTMKQRSTLNNTRTVTEEDLKKILAQACGKI